MIFCNYQGNSLGKIFPGVKLCWKSNILEFLEKKAQCFSLIFGFLSLFMSFWIFFLLINKTTSIFLFKKFFKKNISEIF